MNRFRIVSQERREGQRGPRRRRRERRSQHLSQVLGTHAESGRGSERESYARAENADRLVFVGEGAARNPDIFRANADGSGVVNLTSTPNRGEFIPDCAGEFVAYVSAFRDEEGNVAAEVFRMNPDRTEQTQLTDLNAGVLDIAVEPQ